MVVLKPGEGADAMKEAVEVTAEKSETSVLFYQNSVILTHRLLTIIACVHCGQVKNAIIHPDNGLSMVENDHLQAKLQMYKRCSCP